MTWLLYHLFALIDSVIYGIAEALFRIIFDLANVQFFTNDQIRAVTSRVYIVVGVLMLFKLVISAVQYLINPDAFEDKEKGLAGILKKTAISIGLIVIVPTVFQFLMAVQGPIIKTLPSVILGASPVETVNDQSIGFDLSFSVLSNFVRPVEGKGGSVSDAVGKTSGEIHDMGSFVAHVTDDCDHWFFSTGDKCQYDYKILISTIAGGFLCYMLLGMTLDIAIRTIKMSIIQMLAPIPISGYIVSKDMLNKFVKTATSVYLDLFIRMGIIYFIIFAIQAILETGVLGFGTVTGVNVDNGFRSIVVNILLIFGLLMFASKAPKFISELLGLPDIGSGDLADMFKPAWQRVGGAAYGAVNPLRNAISSAWNSQQQMKDTPLRDTRFHFKNKKIENLRQKLRKARRIAGAGMRGYATGVGDSLQGAFEGDDWAKMRERAVRRDTADFKRAYKAAYYRKMSRKDAAKQKFKNVTDALQSFVGQTPVTSKGYSDAANAVISFRNETFTGRAKGEMDKDADKLQRFSELARNFAGGPFQIKLTDSATARDIKTTFDYKDEAGHTLWSGDYSKIYRLNVRASQGLATEADYLDAGITDKDQQNAAFVRNVYENVGKSSYAEYVNVSMQAKQMLDSGKYNPADKDILERWADKEITERVTRFIELIGTMNIPGDVKEKMWDSLREDPGGWLAGSNKFAQDLQTMATKLGNMEQATGGDSGK